MKVSYAWLKEYVGEAMPSVEKLEELLTFHAFEVDGIESIEGDSVFDIKILPDRASDCLSHRGIAREISAIIASPLAKDILAQDIELRPVTTEVTVTLEDGGFCRRFAVTYIRDVKVQESPDWLKARLKAIGQRPINNIVDATNYVMFALGQPLHAYDAGKFAQKNGIWHFGVRMASSDEKVTTLGNEEHTLDSSIPLITNVLDNRALGIAGIKGGMVTAVDTNTTSILVEAANFDPQIVRKAVQTLRLPTDASKRFENAISPELVTFALHEVTQLITDIAGGVLVGYYDNYVFRKQNNEVTISLAEINALLGLSIAREEVEDIFTRLTFSFTSEGDSWKVIAPFERTDISIREDVIEEVGRLYGYENVEAITPERVPVTEYNQRHIYSEKIRSVLIDAGCSEVITSSFRNKDTIELLNYLASDKGCLRSSLRQNITAALDKNILLSDLLGIADVKIFEIGTVFSKTEDGTDVREHMSFALGVRTKKQGYTAKDDLVLQELVKVLEETLGASLKGKIDKAIFECNLSVLLTNVPSQQQYDSFLHTNDVLFQPYSPYPFIARDLALWVPQGTTSETVGDMIRENAGPLLVGQTLFDEFKKDDRTSFAFRLVFQSNETTLTDEEVHSALESVTREAKNRGYEIR